MADLWRANMTISSLIALILHFQATETKVRNPILWHWTEAKGGLTGRKEFTEGAAAGVVNKL